MAKPDVLESLWTTLCQKIPCYSNSFSSIWFHLLIEIDFDWKSLKKHSQENREFWRDRKIRNVETKFLSIDFILRKTSGDFLSDKSGNISIFAAWIIFSNISNKMFIKNVRMIVCSYRLFIFLSCATTKLNFLNTYNILSAHDLIKISQYQYHLLFYTLALRLYFLNFEANNNREATVAVGGNTPNTRVNK